ncbi:SulP family sulfate permease [Microbacteriaceae bacterium MWH-Ta3]|nr:SulP family sulfate permease [Microbacteriaceae bacterium MWH-Ta3]
MSRTWRHDVVAGITVGIVALPLALAFGVASGVGAEAGLITAVVAGLIAAVFGGSPVQVSGPTGAMVVVLVPIVATYGASAVIVVGVMAGVILIIAGLARLGRTVTFIPWPVIEGFTVGIAIIIFLQQIPLVIGGESAHSSVVASTWNSIGMADWGAAGWSLIVVGIVALIMVIVPRLTSAIPGSIVAIVVVTVWAEAFAIPLTRIGAVPSSLPAPSLPSLDWAVVVDIGPAALAVAALAGIESLLSARVATTMAVAGRYDPDRELVGQGLASVASAAFGGMPATGAIARTAVNVRSGGRTRLSAITHALVLIAVIYVASAPVSRIPLAALAAVLMVTAVRMVPRGAMVLILKSTRSDAAIFLVTIAVTVAFDLIEAVAIGIVATAVFALRSLARSSGIHREELPGPSQPHDGAIALFRLDGALFFGAAERIMERISAVHGARVIIIRMSGMQFLDATGAHILVDIAHSLDARGIHLILKGIQPEHHRLVARVGLPASVDICADLSESIRRARMRSASGDSLTSGN